jgi:hypothetical protein
MRRPSYFQFVTTYGGSIEVTESKNVRVSGPVTLTVKIRTRMHDFIRNMVDDKM